ncbi:S53 family peptidase [Kutzneria sp. CA-103260]|uniref:S53 family peptidase n=1 Tax=Kutzneria sp. CA-103260 TaxID=2802641 RepID=UPI001BEEFAD3|nr:S53 family peptidase [Kutzneria sp. CA-103260]QUQ65507.1 pseudomonapepsin [Kutzneria sp. CA-103260]
MKRSLRVLATSIAPLPVIAGAMLAATTASAATTPLVAVPNTVNPAIAASVGVGELPATDKVSVAVSLKLRDQAGLDKFVSEVGDPHSPEYKHFLTPAQFTAKFGPSRQEVDSVSAFLASHGLSVTPHQANSQVIDATGTADQVGRVFNTRLGLYRQHGREFYANETAPTLPASIAGSVAAVTGLDNHAVLHADAVKQPAATAKAASGLTPSKIKSGYAVSGLGTGSGESVALWEFDGYQASNIATYDSTYGLGSSTPTTVSVDGADYDSSPGDGQGEVELDIEIVQAVAPAASTSVYEAPNSDQGQIDMAAQIAADDSVNVTSISWGECETASSSATISSTHDALAQGVAEGISFYAASGDSGSDDCGDGTTAVDYPASDPDVTGVGGTTLTETSAGAWSKETAWSDGGGGVSTSFSGRTVPDVSADANPSTGYAIYSAGSWVEYGGTSCAAPVWSGITALLDNELGGNQGNLDATFSSIGKSSSYSSAFHDIKSGSNGSYSAGTGYDKVTGWGTPIASGLYSALG